MKVAYFSPFSPMPSGISDFSEELILELKEYMDIDIYAKDIPQNKRIIEMFPVYKFSDIKSIQKFPKEYDHIIYHMGNNITYHKGISDLFFEYSGILELHDISLHHFLAEDTFVRGDFEGYIAVMKYCHGRLGEKVAREFLEQKRRAPWEEESSKFTVNKHYIDHAKAVIVHSDMAKQLVKGIRPEVSVISIPLHANDIFENYQEMKWNARKELGIDENRIIFGSFGYATVAKRIYPILKALSVVKNKMNVDFHYYIVGKVENLDIENELEKLGLVENVTVLGFVTLDIFKKYMTATDICFNLRYPTQGESSATLNRLLGMGKLVFVTDIGSFSEYPDNLVYKIRYDKNEVEDIIRMIEKIFLNFDKISENFEKSITYAKENLDIKNNAKKYFHFLKEISDKKWKEDYLDNILTKICEFERIDRNYSEHIGERLGRWYI